MELNFGKNEAMEIFLNMLKPVFLKFAEHITKAGEDACKILIKEDEFIEIYNGFKTKIKKEKNKKDTKFNKFMRKMSRNIRNETSKNFKK